MLKIELFALRLLFFLFFFLNKIQLWAQGDDDDLMGASSGRRGSNMMGTADMMEGYHPLNIRISDIIIIVLLILACYVFRKIWKGCTYLLLAFAALMYYLISN